MEVKSYMKDIKPLLEKYLQIVNSKENQDNKKYWANADEPYLIERWRGISARRENTPFTMAMDISGYAKVLDISCQDYYSNPEEQLYYQLLYAIWEFENLNCRRYFENTVFVSFGSIFEASMFGSRIIYLQSQAPWIDERNPLLTNKNDILKIKPFNFYRSGLCEKVHSFYDTMKKLTRGYDIKVMFPITMRSPFSTALMLRGFMDLLLDIYEDPQFFNDLLRIITDYLKEYAKRRAGFLGESVAQCMLFNDEIATPIISTEMYRTMILPYEMELGSYCNGVRYWHSCGKSEAFYKAVSELPGLRMMHIGPWSDVEKAVEAFAGKDIALEICLNSLEDIYDKNEVEMRQKLQYIKNMCESKIRYSVRADGFGVFNSIGFTLEKMRAWSRAASEVFPGA